MGVDGLGHISELADPLPSDPHEMVQRDDELVVRILRVDSLGHRIALSLKQVSNRERGEWLAQQAGSQTAEEDKASDPVSSGEEMQPALVCTAVAASPHGW